MLGILATIIGGFAAVSSAVDNGYVDAKSRDTAKKRGNKFYTDVHGNTRYTKTGKKASIYATVPRPKKPIKEIFKIVDLSNREDCYKATEEEKRNAPVIECFDNIRDAMDYQFKYYTTGSSRYPIVSEWIYK